MVDNRAIRCIKLKSEEGNWQAVPELAVKFANVSSVTYDYYCSKELPVGGRAWYEPNDRVLFFTVGPDKDVTKLAAWKKALYKAPRLEHMEYDWEGFPAGYGEKSWVPFPKFAIHENIVKQSEEEYKGIEPFKTTASLAGYTDGPTTAVLGGPNPLSATIGGGLLGAGLGYGTGWLLEKFLPKRYFNKGRLRKALGIGGGIAGAVPGLWWMSAKARQPTTAKEACDALEAVLPEEVANLDAVYEKIAESDNIRAMFEPSINVDAFNRVVWNPLDQQTPAGLRAAASGFISASATGQQSSWVSPFEVARTAVGGLAPGFVAAWAAKTLLGANPEMQDIIARSGLQTNILRRAFLPALGL